MRRICAWSPAVMSATEASVRNGSGRGVTGSGPSAVPDARANIGLGRGVGGPVGDPAAQRVPLVVDPAHLLRRRPG